MIDGIANGNYKWTQISMWELAPPGSIQKYTESASGKDTFHYYLTQISEVTENSWKETPVFSDKEVPTAVLQWGNVGYHLNGELK